MAATTHEEAQNEAEVIEAPDLEAGSLLKKAGIYYIWSEITPGSLKHIHEDVLLKAYLGPRKFNNPIQLIINCEGGLADEAWALIDLLANLRFKVATAGFGTCASAGACLLACGTRGLRTVAPNATIMIHRFSWGTAGKHHELLSHRAAEDHEHSKDVAFWIRHSKYKTRKEVEKYLLRKEDTWLTPKEAVRHGVVDKIGSVLL